MAFLDTVLFNDNDVRALPYLKVLGIQHRAPGIRRGDHEPVPGRNGKLPARLALDTFNVTVSVRIFGASRGERNDNLALVVDLFGGGVNGIGTLKRRKATGSADDYIEHHASASFMGGFDMSPDNDLMGVCDLIFENLSGCWLDGSGNVFLG